MAQTILVGPLVDVSDGVTPIGGSPTYVPTALLSVNGGLLEARNETDPLAFDDEAYYTADFDVTDTGTPGRLDLAVSDAATHIPVLETRTILPTHIATWFITGSGVLEVIVLDSGSPVGSPPVDPPPDPDPEGDEVTLSIRSGQIVYPFMLMRLDQGVLACSKVGQAINDDAADYFGGRKHPIVSTFGPLTRRLSSDTGGLDRPTMSASFDDSSRVIRTLLAEGEVFDGREMIWYGDVRPRDGLPRMLARGLMRQPDGPAGFGITIEAYDPLSIAWAKVLPVRRVNTLDFPGLGRKDIPDTPINMVVPIVLGAHYGDTTEPATIPTIPLDTETITAGGAPQLFGRLLVCGDAMTSIDRLFVGDEEKTIIGASASTKYLVPGQFRWLATALGTDMTRTINGQTFTIVYVHEGSQAWINARDRKVPITLCGVGVSSTGSPAAPLLSLPLQLRWLLINHIFGNKTTDVEEAAQLWANGDPKIDEDSFQDVDDLLNLRVDGGMRGSVILNEPQTAEEVIGKFLRCADMRLHATRRQALKATCFNKDAMVSKTVPHRLIRAGGFSWSSLRDQQSLVMYYNFGERKTRQGGWHRERASSTVPSDETNYPATERELPVLELPYLREVATAQTAPTVALAGVGAGSVTNGYHQFAIAFGFYGDSPMGPRSVPLNVVNNADNGKVALSNIPVPDDPLVTAKCLFVSKAGLLGVEMYFGGLLAAADTTHLFNIPDVGLTAENIDEYFHQNLAQINVDHRHRRIAETPIEVPLELTGLDLADVDCGDVLAVSHPEGLGASGYVDRKLEIQALTINMDTLTSSAVCLDHDLVASDTVGERGFGLRSSIVPPKSVEVTDAPTKTGPIPGERASFYMGATEGFEAVVTPDTFQDLTNSVAQRLTRESKGERKASVRAIVNAVGGTVTVRVTTLDNDQVGEDESTSTHDEEVELEIPIAAELHEGETPRYKLRWTNSTADDTRVSATMELY